MAILSLTEAKTFLQITDTSKDAIITALIPVVQEDVVEYCNRDFLNDAGAEDWPGPVKFAAAQMISYNMKLTAKSGGESIASESIGDYSYTKKGDGNFINGYPGNIMKTLSKYRFLRSQSGTIVITDPEVRGYDQGIIPESVKKWL
jgi:hypothetical protein